MRKPPPGFPATSFSRTPTESRPGQSTFTLRPRAVWPWIAQMGPSPRGGAYTYDWIENLLGLDMHSADRVLPEFQHPEVGDTIGYGSNRLRVERVEPEHVLAWRSQDGNWVWTFVLTEHAGSTRLDQPQPLPAADARRPGRHDPDGARLAAHGAEDAARDQAARGGIAI